MAKKNKKDVVPFPELKKPEIKYIKLQNGKNLVSVVEYNPEYPSSIVLHDPHEIIFFKVMNESNTPEVRISLEQFIPEIVVDMPVITVRVADIFSISDINEKFRNSFTKFMSQEAEKVSGDKLEAKHQNPEDFGEDDLVKALKDKSLSKKEKNKIEKVLESKKKKLH